jgi:uncharacterized Ntn-hydrolase superfamily protein
MELVVSRLNQLLFLARLTSLHSDKLSMEVDMKIAAWIVFLSLCFCNFSFAEVPAHTYSIVARDTKTGEIGVAVQSHYFSVGARVPWAEAGIGAVATQSFTEVTYGPLGLELMKSGKTAEQALKSLLASDNGQDVRQVAMIDANGVVAAHTGKKCIAAAGHITGKDYSVQANLMENSNVWPAMSKAFEAAQGSLAERMLAALEAAQKAGGDIRGEQSAAMLIVSGTRTGIWWKDRLLDLRVEDHPHPLQELRRLINLHEAYKHEDQGDEFIAKKDLDQALKEYEMASKLDPENMELLFWAAVGVYNAGQEQKALEMFGRVFEKAPHWYALVDRLPASDLISKEAVARIQELYGKRN